MLKLKLQYFGHLMQRADSFEKTLMLGKIEGRRRRPSQEGSLKKEKRFQIPGNTLTAKPVVSLGTTEGNITGRKNK